MIKCVNHTVVRHEKPLTEIKAFFEDFGMIASHESDDRIYFRGFEGRPYIYVAERGPKGLASVGYELESAEALAAAAEKFGAEITPINSPWGGQQISIQDPDGNLIDLVWGIPQLAPVTLPRPPVMFNSAGDVQRKGRFPIFNRGPAPVLHLCHVVQNSSEPARLIDWYTEHLGGYASDVLVHPTEGRVGAFIRFPHGDRFVEHHNVAVFKGPPNEPQHTCFETLDLDALQIGHHYLRSKGYRSSWGPVRHALGGAISDYWVDPSGFRVEHVTDGDVLNDSFPTDFHPAGEDSLMQWGPSLPGDFLD